MQRNALKISGSWIGPFLVAVGALSLSACGNEEEPEPANRAPSLLSALEYRIPENRAAVTTLAARDPEGDPVSLRISGGADGALFRLPPGTATLYFASAPDFEDPRDQDGNNLYEVRVTAEDSEGATSSALVRVAVEGVEEPPVIQAPDRIDVPEEQRYAYVINAFDPEGTAPSFSIEGGVDSGLFSIEPDTGTLRLKEVPDFEHPGDSNLDNYHEVVVGVRDGAGQLATHALTVHVTEVNEAPSFSSASLQTVAENRASVTTLAASDPEGEPLHFGIEDGEDSGLFRVDEGSGELDFIDAPDFEAPSDADGDNRYHLQVAVTDYRGATTLQALEVRVEDRTRDVRADLVFPPPGAHFGGRVSEVALAGRLTDLEDPSITHSDINYIDVDGKRVSPDSADPSRWHTVLPMDQRDRQIEIEVSMADGSLHQSQVMLRNAPFFRATSIAGDPANNRVLLPGLKGSGQVVAVDLAEKERIGIGDCPDIHRIDHLVLDDPGDQVIAAVTSGAGDPSLWRMNIPSGGCSRLSGGGLGGGPSLGRIGGLALDEDVDADAGEHERVLLVDRDNETIVQVDKQTGDRSLFAGGGAGGDPAFQGPGGLVLDTARYQALLPEGGDSLLAMALDTGFRETVSSALNLTPQSPVALDAYRQEAYVVNATGGIDAVALADGQVMTLAEAGAPTEATWLGPIRDLEVDPASERLLVASDDRRSSGRLLSVRTWSGEKALLSSNGVSDGPAFGEVRDMAVDSVAGTAYVLADDAITEVDLRSGKRERHLLTGYSGALSLVHDAAAARLLVLAKPTDAGDPVHLVSVTPPDYRTEVVSRFDGAGITPISPGNMALDEANDRIFLADAGLRGLVSIDLANGEARLFSGEGRGVGPALEQINDLLVDSAGDRVIAVEATYGLLGIDRQSGDRTDLLPANREGKHPDAALHSIGLDTGGSVPRITGVRGKEVQRIDLEAGTIEKLTGLAPPPGAVMDKVVSVKTSPYREAVWMLGDSGRLLVMSNQSFQWAVLSR